MHQSEQSRQTFVSRLHLVSSAVALVCVLASACTPIAAVNHDDTTATDQKRGDVSAAGADGANTRDETTGSAPETSSLATAQAASSCGDPGKRACASGDPRSPLLCKDAIWQAQNACSDSERCETKAGPQLGTCVPIATECLMHPAGEDFCDGDFLSACENLVVTGAHSCPDPLRRCKIVDNKARCACAMGWVEAASGECEVPTTCATDNGGCDSTTSCDASSGQRVCGKCNPGFEGSGETGCFAQLAQLSLEDAQLVPEFSPDVHSYRVALPLLHQNLRLTAQLPPGIKLDFDAVDQQPGRIWQSAPLPLGEHKIEINLSTDTGRKSKYELLVSRGGAQEAYAKASNPGMADEYGASVAIWGDTMAIGAIREDSASSTNQADNSVEDSGAVYIFVRKGNTWTQQDYLKASPALASDYFGISLALREDLLVVGASGANAIGSSAPHGGSVHIFKRQGEKWSFLTKLSPADIGLQDGFGVSVACDDKWLIVGAPMESNEQRFSGGFYAFPRNGDDFGKPQHFKANKPLASGLFAWSLALDGESLVVGAPQYNSTFNPADSGSGTAYVFSASGAAWTQVQEFAPSASLETGATMGWKVAIAGDTIAVGAPRARTSNEGQPPGEVFIYERASGGGWDLKHNLQAAVPRVSDWYGYTLQLTATALVVSSPGDNSGSTGLLGDPKNQAAKESGSLFVYGRVSVSKDEWLPTAFIKASNPSAADNFGGALAISGDTLVTSSVGESSNATGVNGDQTNESAAATGAAYVFR